MTSQADPFFHSACAARDRGDWESALSHIQRAVRLAPDRAEYHAESGTILFMLGRKKEAARAYEQALALNPNHLNTLNNLAVIYSQEERYQEAEELLHHSLAQNPNQLEAWLNLCSTVENLNFREEDAVSYARRAVALAPRNPRTYRYLCKALLRKGDPIAALEAIETALGLAPRDADIHYSLGVCHIQLDQIPEAIQAFQTALAINPSHGDTYGALAELLSRLKEWPAAEEAARHARDFLSDKIAGDLALAKILFAQEKYAEGKECHVRARNQQDRLLNASKGTPLVDRKFVLAPVESVEQWCHRHALPYRETLPESVWQSRPPIVAGFAPTDIPLPPARLPHAYIAEVRDATVLPGHEVVLVDKEQIALYDRLIRMGDWYSLREEPIVPLIGKTHVLAECGPLADKQVKEGIFMFSEGWYNYAHWLIEQLPRLFSVEKFSQYDGMPLLVNDGLYPQQLESLELLSQGRYPITVLQKKYRHRVERLVYPTNLTEFIKRRYQPGERAGTADGPFHPEAIDFLRQRLLPQCTDNPKPRRRLWLSRRTQKKTGQRRLVNEHDIEALFVAKGFDVVFPETLTFREQVAMFAEAEMIAGPAGAAMINIVFAPPGARVMVLTKNHPQVNFHYFTNIGQIVGFDVAHVCGEAIENFGVYGFETDFTVGVDIARQAMHDFFGI